VVTWAIGHLVELAEPHQMQADWKRWQWASLPMLPTEWPLVVIDQTREQFDAQPLPSFERLIDEELQKAKDAVAKGVARADYYQKHVVEQGAKSL
jgi:DNA topoisomerase IA